MFCYLVSKNLSTSAKVANQHERTWAQLHQRLISIPLDYECLFPPLVTEFVNKKAASLGSCPGYLVPCLLNTSSPRIPSFEVVPRICHPTFIWFCRSTGFGKIASPELKEGALQPMHDVCTERDMQNRITEKCTSRH